MDVKSYNVVTIIINKRFAILFSFLEILTGNLEMDAEKMPKLYFEHSGVIDRIQEILKGE